MLGAMLFAYVFGMQLSPTITITDDSLQISAGSFYVQNLMLRRIVKIDIARAEHFRASFNLDPDKTLMSVLLVGIMDSEGRARGRGAASLVPIMIIRSHDGNPAGVYLAPFSKWQINKMVEDLRTRDIPVDVLL
jgi:hypothetical protein